MARVHARNGGHNKKGRLTEKDKEDMEKAIAKVRRDPPGLTREVFWQAVAVEVGLTVGAAKTRAWRWHLLGQAVRRARRKVPCAGGCGTLVTERLRYDAVFAGHCFRCARKGASRGAAWR